MRLVVAALVLPAILGACDGKGWGVLQAEGAWSDGEAIHFRQSAQLIQQPDGRIDIRAVAPVTPRFIGIRISYSPAEITAAGTYEVDPAGTGGIAFYCISPAEGVPVSMVVPPRRFVESQVKSATITLDVLPSPGEPIGQGTFSNVRLESEGEEILTLWRGAFWAN